MSINEKQYEIIFWESDADGSGNRHVVRVPVSKEVFDDYYRPINAYRQRMFEHKACFCPKSKWLLCNMDCYNCQYQAEGDRPTVESVTNKDGEELDIWEVVSDGEPSIEETYCNDERIKALKAKVSELDEDAKAICEAVMAGYSEREAAQKLGISRNTYTYRRDKLFAALKKFLEKF